MEAMMACKTIDDLGLAGKVVLTRVDINVPMEGGVVTDATRIEKIAPTVEDIIARGGKVVLLAHFGRPKGKVVDEMSLRHVVGAVQVALGRKVVFGADCVGPVAAAAIAAAGRLMEAELRALEAALGTPERPVVAVVGGAKVSTKLDLLGNLVSKVDHLVIGGGMANTFLVAQGIEVGKS